MGNAFFTGCFPLIGEQGNAYCKEVFEYYNQRHFLLPDGSLDMLISPKIMTMIAEKKGYKREDVEQRLGDDIIIYPSCFSLARQSDTLRLLPAIRCMVVGENVASVEKN